MRPVGKMLKIFKFICFLAILLLGVPGKAEDLSELTEKDLDQFIRDTPAFIVEVRNQHLDGQLIGLFLHPEQIRDDLPLRQILIELRINPDRYAYIFSHVILGGFIRDMGEFGDGKVKFLKDQRKKWQASNEPDKDKVVAELDRSIPDVEEIAEKTKKIPIAELQLFWGRREELNDILMGKLPVKRKELRKTF